MVAWVDIEEAVEANADKEYAILVSRKEGEDQGSKGVKKVRQLKNTTLKLYTNLWPYQPLVDSYLTHIVYWENASNTPPE